MSGAWDTEDGLETRYEGEVTDAYFEEGQYGVTLKLKVFSPTLEQEIENWYGCGKGVKLVSDSEVDLAAMKGGKFNTNSAVGQLITYLRKDPALIGQVAEKGSPDDAKSYIGLKAVWERITFKATIDGTEREYQRVLPVAPVGGDEPDDQFEVPKWLVEVAVNHDTYDAFVSAALEDERLTAADRKVVLKPEFWDFKA